MPHEMIVSVRPPLIGRYTPPAVRKGVRVTCLYRDSDCVVTSIHDAPIAMVTPRM